MSLEDARAALIEAGVPALPIVAANPREMRDGVSAVLDAFLACRETTPCATCEGGGYVQRVTTMDPPYNPNFPCPDCDGTGMVQGERVLVGLLMEQVTAFEFFSPDYERHMDKDCLYVERDGSTT